MFSVHHRERVGKIWILAFYSEQPAIAQVFSETAAEISQAGTARSLERAIVHIRIANVIGKRGAGSAGAADSTVENSNVDLRQAETKLVEYRRTECMSVAYRNLPRVANLIAGAESGSRQARQEIRAIGLEILIAEAAR